MVAQSVVLPIVLQGEEAHVINPKFLQERLSEDESLRVMAVLNVHGGEVCARTIDYFKLLCKEWPAIFFGTKAGVRMNPGWESEPSVVP